CRWSPSTLPLSLLTIAAIGGVANTGAPVGQGFHLPDLELRALRSEQRGSFHARAGARVPARLSFPAINGKSVRSNCAARPARRRAAKPEISEIPAACLPSRRPSNAALWSSWEKAPRSCSRSGHLDLLEGATRWR